MFCHHSLAVRTLASHAENKGSIPFGGTIFLKYEHPKNTGVRIFYYFPCMQSQAIYFAPLFSRNFVAPAKPFFRQRNNYSANYVPGGS